ncbi:hypothetical protein OIU74_025179 [Salix koriyanagi]|uniref:Uncharacterized protein n=1 Tax=Salix koriyanagi TaxID=2511006 RepID=A0A9Q0W1T6_9ROSI|nr:hypothetical protein OIU74_025179 [Salix koriyanagi]
MLETNTLVVTPDVERRVNEGFKAWMGSSLLSSDEEDEPDSYSESPHITRTTSNRQRGLLKEQNQGCLDLVVFTDFLSESSFVADTVTR